MDFVKMALAMSKELANCPNWTNLFASYLEKAYKAGYKACAESKDYTDYETKEENE